MLVQRDDGYQINTDKALLNVDFVHAYIGGVSYWAKGRSRAVMEAAIANSLCFGVFAPGPDRTQVGFARIVTDYAVFAYLCDLFVDPAHQGHGLGKFLVQSIVNAPELAQVRRFMLTTNDAHELYRRYGGFELLTPPENWLARINP